MTNHYYKIWNTIALLYLSARTPLQIKSVYISVSVYAFPLVSCQEPYGAKKMNSRGGGFRKVPDWLLYLQSVVLSSTKTSISSPNPTHQVSENFAEKEEEQVLESVLDNIETRLYRQNRKDIFELTEPRTDSWMSVRV